MADDLIPEEVKEFLLKNIDSIAQLEGLLLLRASPETKWRVEEIAQRLYIDPEETANLLEQLCELGLVTKKKGASPTYQFLPDSTELQKIVDRVAETYATYLVPVTNLIHAKPQTRVQRFADAFRLRKERRK